VQITRGLYVPVLRGDAVVAIMGVGNKPSHYDEYDQSLVSQVAEIALDYIERNAVEKRVQQMAFSDVLTGLPNRRLLTDRLEQALALARRERHLVAICYLDLDGFKPVNDRWGHDVGDRLLVEYTHRLQQELRASDTLARIGGDEFVVLMTQVDRLNSVERVIGRLLQVSAEPFIVEGTRARLSASIGVTVFPDDNVDADALVRHADQAMYAAKSSGKNTFAYYDARESERAHERRMQTTEFERALVEEQLVLHLQPRIALDSGVVVGFEALVRWQHPQRGLLYPDAFLGLIEGTPLQGALDHWVLSEAVALHRRWRAAGHNLSISVNLTPYSLQQEDFPERLRELLGDPEDDIARYFELEVLEQSSIDDIGVVAEVMQSCVRMGVQFSLDDFGTGFSSLTYFHSLPISTLKIDRCFVQQMLSETRDFGIVEGVLRLAQAIGRPVVAEGVESIELGLLLALNDCQYAQGFGISPPLPEAEVLSWLETWNCPDNEWFKLDRHLNGPTQRSDLNVAVFTLRRWQRRMQAAIARREFDVLAAESEANCTFGVWMNGIGAAHFGNRSHWEEVGTLHHAVHSCMNQLASNTDPSAVAELYSEMLQRAQALEQTLIRLSR
jgi:diguanylate cyclase (GGDEF)-like protein